MATLVLTAVGGAIGGPIGAAIGGVLGQAVDARVLAPKGRQGPRLSELAVQTSSYGTAIPRIFGTMRVAGTVIWATDLVEHASRTGGGKGRGASTAYSYTASFAVALSARAILRVGRIWADGALLRGSGGDFRVATGFRVHPGGEAQGVDPLIAAAEGAGMAPAHRGVAYAVFEDLALAEFGNRIPSLTFEVIADEGAVSVGAISRALAPRSLSGAGPALALDGFAAAGDSVRSVLEALQAASGAWFRPVPGGLAMDAGDGAAIVVEDAGAGGAPHRMRAIAPIDTLPRTISVRDYDPARDWQVGVQQARRPGAGRRVERVEVAAAVSGAVAKTIATAMLARGEAERTRRQVTLDMRGAAIAPGARVRIAGEAGLWRVARTTIEAMATVLELVPVVGASPALAATSGRVLAQPDVAGVATIVRVLETPALDEALLTAPRLSIAAAGTAPGWRRATLLYTLDDGATWIEAGGTAAPAVIGVLAAATGGGPTTLVDQAGAIEVTLAHAEMALASADAGAIDAGANVALVGDELIQFARADAVSAGRWRLSGLRRGWRGTGAVAHAAGTRFVLIEATSVVTIALPSWATGRTVRVLASGAGDGGGAAGDSAAVTGVSMLPPAPVAATCTPLAGGGARIGWRRRSRAGWRWRDGVDAPLGEERERYRVTVATPGGAARTIETDAPVLDLPPGETGAGTAIAIRQVGVAGESAPLDWIM